jgi:hypothetical protein
MSLGQHMWELLTKCDEWLPGSQLRWSMRPLDETLLYGVVS